MISRRTIVISLLLLAPVLVYIGFGGYALWQTGLFRWTWWIIPVCWTGTYLLASLWKKRDALHDSFEVAAHWTPQDEAAAEIVQNHQRQVDEIEPEQLIDLQFYVKSAQELARSLSVHYHPEANEPLSSLTVVEILAAIRLAVDDLEDWFQESIPGSHLITVGQWKLLSQAPKWVQRASDAGWLASLFWNPLNAARYVTSKMTITPITNELKTEILAAVYLRFIRHIGFYLIEMNSGRLRRGALRYQSTFGDRSSDEGEKRPIQIDPKSVTIALVGQVKAGKSSLVNALIGRHETESDVLPKTRLVSRHKLEIPDSTEQITLLDTPGYADAGATSVEKKELKTAIEEADVVLLIVDAHSPAKSADVDVLEQIEQQYADDPQLRPRPVIVCLTHVDLLSPMMEWDPPYDWANPQSAKERSIGDAVSASRDVFASFSEYYVPVCADIDRNRTWNVDAGLIAKITTVLPEGKAVGLLKAYEADLDRDRWSALFSQLKTSGKTMLNIWIDERLKSASKAKKNIAVGPCQNLIFRMTVMLSSSLAAHFPLRSPNFFGLTLQLSRQTNRCRISRRWRGSFDLSSHFPNCSGTAVTQHVRSSL